MNYLSLKKFDIANGIGWHVSLWVSGCTNGCKGCFNPQSHDFNAGKPFTDETMAKLLNELKKPMHDALTITGGDPLHPRNAPTVKEIIDTAKCECGKPIWVWTRI